MIKLLENMTWRDVEGYLSQRNDIIIPIGSVEEHGFHLPLSTDSIIAEELSKAIGERVSIMIAPPIHYGICRHTAGYPGTINVRPETLRMLIGDLLEDYHRHGFNFFYILIGHAGTVHRTMIGEAARNAALKFGIKTFIINPFEIEIPKVRSAVDDLHAGEVETSLMLYLRPENVDLKKAIGGIIERERFRVPLYERPTESGVFGDPLKASQRKGKHIFNMYIKEISAYIQENKKME